MAACIKHNRTNDAACSKGRTNGEFRLVGGHGALIGQKSTQQRQDRLTQLFFSNLASVRGINLYIIDLGSYGHYRL